MMQVIKFPEASSWENLLKRPVQEEKKMAALVEPILQEVKKGGDEALIRFNRKFDGYDSPKLEVTKEEIDQAEATVSRELKLAILLAKDNIARFHEAQKQDELSIETAPGVICSRKSVPIEKVGHYIPGGTAPLFSTVLMLGVPAGIAGCGEVILCTPPGKQGEIHPAILYTARLVGIDKIIKTGGAQAIAAMAYGTATVPQVYKIFGPGNQYVTMAKQLVNAENTAIDMPAGPSEVAVMADEKAIPEFVAADLLSQAEHGIDSQVILVSTSEAVIEKTNLALTEQLSRLPRKEIAEASLANSLAILVNNQDEALALLNQYGPEHLILAVQNEDEVAEKVTNAGSVFIGNFSPESAGDYASGTNHTLPTNGFAKAYSGVSLDSFVKKITFQKLTEEGLQNIGNAVEVMAAAEELIGHKEAVSVRLKYLDNKGYV